MNFRQLQISSFNGKMNALNEINKVIANVTYYPNRHHSFEEEEYLTPERMAVSLFEFIIIIIHYSCSKQTFCQYAFISNLIIFILF